MADVTGASIKEVRERTSAGIMECKKALLEAHGDIELAIDNMRKSGKAKAAKKAGRITAEGIILTKIAQDGKYGVIIELNCETDFVNKDSGFRTFGDKVITTALNKRITDIETLQTIFEEQRTALISKITENINIRRLGFLEGEELSSYMHGGRIGVIVSTSDANKELAKHVAMHIAANKPEYINPDDIPADVIAREHKIQLNIAIQSGKPCEIAERIVEGRMRKFITEISMTGQYFVVDQNKTVGQILSEHGAKINNFIRFEVGEGIKKIKVDFTAEVAKMVKNFN
ncbi:MAG: translation elongation factor Ts [Sodalis sp. (in: enterobacteria)]